MKEVTLTTGRVVKIEALNLRQVRQMSESVDSGKSLAALVDACTNSMRRAYPSNEGITAEWFEEDFTVPESNELYGEVLAVSGLKVGETKAAS